MNKLKKGLKQQILTRKNEFDSYIRTVVKPQFPQGKFIIFAMWRSGSTLLAQLLNSHSEVFCDIELFLRFYKMDYNKTILFPHTYIKGCASRFEEKTYGFDLKLYQIKNCVPKSKGTPKDFITKLHDNGWKIIYLKRTNLVRQAISNLVAHERQQWNDWQNKPIVRSKVAINDENLLNLIEDIEKLTAEEFEIIKDIPHIKVNYEKDLLRSDDHQKTSDQIFKYLGLNKHPVEARTKRLSFDNLEDVVENYSDVVNKLERTEYLKYLYED